MSRQTSDALSLAESVCLALIVEGPQHGWSLVRELAPDGPIGRIWTLSRPLTYRALDQLVERGYVERKGSVPGAGPQRQMLAATASGRKAARAWLRHPVQHLRDVRTELLLKLTFVERAGGDPETLLLAQRDAFAPMLNAIATTADQPGADLVDRWRHESSLAVQRFIASELGLPGPQ